MILIMRTPKKGPYCLETAKWLREAFFYLSLRAKGRVVLVEAL